MPTALLAMFMATVASGVAGTPATKLTTLYVNKFFEVRDHDAPTKYVFNGNTRVARVTGSLSTNLRLQRLRVYAGWNLCSLAVMAPDARSQLSAANPQPALEALYRWVPQSGSFAAVAEGETLSAGTVLWLKSTTNTSLSVTGSYAEPRDVLASRGGNFIAAAGLEVWCLTNTLAPGMAAWKRDPRANQWTVRLGDALPQLSDLPDVVAPGEGIFIEANAPAYLEVPAAALSIRYYHQDHLKSSAVTSDSAGAVVEETAFFPFGEPRNAAQLQTLREDYKFTQKEQDRESGLGYFEARYLCPVQGRFISPDPLLDSDSRRNPQSGNCYAYAMNNPLKYVDPRGLYVWDASLGGTSLDTGVSPDVLEQRNAIRDALQKGKEKANTLPTGADKDLVLRGFNVYGAENDANGISVGSQTGSAGHTKYHADKVKVTLAKGVKGWSLAGTLAHEGTHAADDLEFWAAAKNDRKAARSGPLNRTDYEQEFRGYKVESIIAQATHPKGHLNKGGYVIWDATWKADEIEKNRTAAINELLAKTPIYQLTPEKPGSRLLP